MSVAVGVGEEEDELLLFVTQGGLKIIREAV